MRLPLVLLVAGAVVAGCGGGPSAPSVAVTTSAPPAAPDQAQLVIGVATTFNDSLLDGDGATACAQLTARGSAAFVTAANLGPTCEAVVTAIHTSLTADKITKGKKFVVAKASVSGTVATISDSDITVDGAAYESSNPLPLTFLLVDGVWKIDNLG